MKGRKPVPTVLKLIRGNPGKRALPENEPKPAIGADMPDWLSLEAQKHWPIVSRQLLDAGVLTRMDATALGLYCESWARWKHANDHIAKFGPLVKSASGIPMQSPLLAIANTAWMQMTKMLIEFGMTPSSRTRVTVAAHQEEENPFAAIFNRKKIKS